MLTKIAIISALSFTLFISSTYFNIEHIENSEWEKIYENGAFYSIIKCNDGYMVVGYKRCNNNTQGWLVKIDAEGNIIWEKTYGGKGDDEFKKIIKEVKISSLLVKHLPTEMMEEIFGLLKWTKMEMKYGIKPMETMKICF